MRSMVMPMADIYDKATEREEMDRNDAIAAQAAIAAATIRPTPQGHCLNPLCCEPFHQDESERLYCGRDCANAHDRFLKK